MTRLPRAKTNGAPRSVKKKAKAKKVLLYKHCRHCRILHRAVRKFQGALQISSHEMGKALAQMLNLTLALRDLLALYDKVSGAAPEEIRGVGWSWPDMKRLAEIRALLSRDS